ncbi:hypothetical protein [Methylocystis sp. SC2]|uniref:hypothetical protein n=1 Tax=Methylocystis sp. (strain SC2) TaxID=187303 RepID=UPI0011D2336D|nr:hypothetical protein [Methylocystis sp. SC2]
MKMFDRQCADDNKNVGRSQRPDAAKAERTEGSRMSTALIGLVAAKDDDFSSRADQSSLEEQLS